VAGATGYAGGHVALALHEAGYHVRALARDESRLSKIRYACDEVFVGEATRPESLAGLFDGASVAFSSIGIRHVHRRPTFREVDRDANLALVAAAEKAGVKRFGFISVFRGNELRDRLQLADARETVVDALEASTMSAVVLRPTGFFNDMAEFFTMAKKGRVWLLGKGCVRLNPIHGADLGSALVDALSRPAQSLLTVPIGGPDTFSMREIGELAFRVIGRAPRFGHVPTWVVTSLGKLAKPFNANMSAMAEAFGVLVGDGGVAPARGSHRLEAFYRHLAAGGDLDDLPAEHALGTS
jgi:uncharacterized protein YbjT (DUF2867 family)